VRTKKEQKEHKKTILKKKINRKKTLKNEKKERSLDHCCTTEKYAPHTIFFSQENNSYKLYLQVRISRFK